MRCGFARKKSGMGGIGHCETEENIGFELFCISHEDGGCLENVEEFSEQSFCAFATLL